MVVARICCHNLFQLFSWDSICRQIIYNWHSFTIRYHFLVGIEMNHVRIEPGLKVNVDIEARGLKSNILQLLIFEGLIIILMILHCTLVRAELLKPSFVMLYFL